jgi:hypothetical protein
LADAREVFLGRGYTAATIATIAQAAGVVVVETIYRALAEFVEHDCETQSRRHLRGGPAVGSGTRAVPALPVCLAGEQCVNMMVANRPRAGRCRT